MQIFVDSQYFKQTKGQYKVKGVIEARTVLAQFFIKQVQSKFPNYETILSKIIIKNIKNDAMKSFQNRI